MVWKDVNNADPGDVTHFGGNDFDKIADLFNDVSNVDTVKIDSIFELIASKFKIRDATDESKEITKMKIIIQRLIIKFVRFIIIFNRHQEI